MVCGCRTVLFSILVRVVDVGVQGTQFSAKTALIFHLRMPPQASVAEWLLLRMAMGYNATSQGGRYQIQHCTLSRSANATCLDH
jgi:hypothetical protein